MYHLFQFLSPSFIFLDFLQSPNRETQRQDSSHYFFRFVCLICFSSVVVLWFTVSPIARKFEVQMICALFLVKGDCFPEVWFLLYCCFHQIDYPEIAEGIGPRHRFMSAYEQRIEPPDRRWQYLLMAAEPYETIAFKVRSWNLTVVYVIIRSCSIMMSTILFS